MQLIPAGKLEISFLQWIVPGCINHTPRQAPCSGAVSHHKMDYVCGEPFVSFSPTEQYILSSWFVLLSFGGREEKENESGLGRERERIWEGQGRGNMIKHV